MNNRMIVYERKGTVSPLTSGASSSSTPSFRNPIENNFQPKAILPWSWCKFCEEHRKESTCEVRKSDRDKIFGKRPETTIVVLDFAEPEDVMIINTRNKLLDHVVIDANGLIDWCQRIDLLMIDVI